MVCSSLVTVGMAAVTSFFLPFFIRSSYTFFLSFLWKGLGKRHLSFLPRFFLFVSARSEGLSACLSSGPYVYVYVHCPVCSLLIFPFPSPPLLHPSSPVSFFRCLFVCLRSCIVFYPGISVLSISRLFFNGLVAPMTTRSQYPLQ